MALYERFYYNGSIRKMTVAFGTLFSGIFVSRRNSAGVELEREIVPITYSSKEKFFQRLEQDPDLMNKPAIKLPHLAFEITGYAYDSERKFSSKKKVFGVAPENAEQYNYYYTPIPYNITYELNLITKTQEEGLQIIEQILPMFTPDYVLTLKMTDINEYKQDIPISLTSVNCSDSYSGNIGDRRTINWTLTFMLRGYIIGPERNSKRVLSSNVTAVVGGVQTPIQPIQPSNPSLSGNANFGVVEGIDGSIFDLTTSANDGKTLMLDVPRAQDFEFIIEVANESGALVNLDGYNLYGRFRKNFSHPGVYPIEVSKGQDIGTIRCMIRATTTNTLENGLYIGEVSIENPQTTQVYRALECILKIG
jgi:hypothetical protein